MVDRDAPYYEGCDCGDGSGALPAGCSGHNASTPDATCRTNCQPARCGDGIVDVGRGEECDDGNLFPGDGCTGGCIIERCGNGIIDLALVGGSYLPVEACDDGENGLNHDGCANGCLPEFPLWTGPPPSTPSPRRSLAMAYDAARGRTILFGGFSGFPGALDGETWEYDGTTATWTLATPAGSSPSPREYHAMAYDAARGRVVLFGGSDSGGYFGETWEYDSTSATWTQVIPTGSSPSPRVDR